jgi:hypothetical protein
MDGGMYSIDSVYNRVYSCIFILTDYELCCGEEPMLQMMDMDTCVSVVSKSDAYPFGITRTYTHTQMIRGFSYMQHTSKCN